MSRCRSGQSQQVKRPGERCVGDLPQSGGDAATVGVPKGVDREVAQCGHALRLCPVRILEASSANVVSLTWCTASMPHYDLARRQISCGDASRAVISVIA